LKTEYQMTRAKGENAPRLHSSAGERAEDGHPSAALKNHQTNPGSADKKRSSQVPFSGNPTERLRMAVTEKALISRSRRSIGAASDVIGLEAGGGLSVTTIW
jgi:hypothetical protein